MDTTAQPRILGLWFFSRRHSADSRSKSSEWHECSLHPGSLRREMKGWFRKMLYSGTRAATEGFKNSSFRRHSVELSKRTFFDLRMFNELILVRLKGSELSKKMAYWPCVQDVGSPEENLIPHLFFPFKNGISTWEANCHVMEVL